MKRKGIFTTENTENTETISGAKNFSPQRETELEPIPAHWRVVRLGEVATLSTKAVDPANAGTKRYIGLEHIEPENIRIQHWGKADDVRSLKTAFQQGDVLYGKLRPYLDKCWQNGTESVQPTSS
jgi:type I restriction enzyme S subunit